MNAAHAPPLLFPLAGIGDLDELVYNILCGLLEQLVDVVALGPEQGQYAIAVSPIKSGMGHDLAARVFEHVPIDIGGIGIRTSAAARAVGGLLEAFTPDHEYIVCFQFRLDLLEAWFLGRIDPFHLTVFLFHRLDRNRITSDRFADLLLSDDFKLGPI